MKPIRKAVFPVAGLGTRFLPATKAMPKEMLPIVDKPLIQYAVEEAVAAGITDLIFITGRNKRAIEDHFDRAPELEADLTAKHKTRLLDIVRNVHARDTTVVWIEHVIQALRKIATRMAVLYGGGIIADGIPDVVLANENVRSIYLGEVT